MRRLRLAAAALALRAALPPLPAAAAPDPTKVIRDVFPVAETGFDPQAVHDLYSGTVVQALFETLYSYDYLARPSKVVPLAAEAMPQVSDEGKTYVIRVRRGIFFTPDAAFGSAKRELTGLNVLGTVSLNWTPAEQSRRRRGQVALGLSFSTLLVAFGAVLASSVLIP